MFGLLSFLNSKQSTILHTSLTGFRTMAELGHVGYWKKHKHTQENCKQKKEGYIILFLNRELALGKTPKCKCLRFHCSIVLLLDAYCLTATITGCHYVLQVQHKLQVAHHFTVRWYLASLTPFLYAVKKHIYRVMHYRLRNPTYRKDTTMLKLRIRADAQKKTPSLQYKLPGNYVLI